MQQNIAKGNSMPQKDSVVLDPVSGSFEMTMGNGSKVNFDSDNLTVEFTYQTKDYQEQFEEKRQALHDIVQDGDGLRKEEVADLVKTANLAVWQKSKD